MSLKFIFGPSGSGKSRQIYEEITRRAKEEPKRNFLIIVPDQFTMQTQKELVLLNDRGGIMNIDVLSFGRLSYRILEEVGREELPVLDDTGKSLVLQKVAANCKSQLPVLGNLLHKQGYIHEAKSAISEFMQYGIGTKDVEKLIAYAHKRAALAGKLKDLETLYQGFMDYIQGNFITTEETLDVLRRSLHLSRLLPGSVVVFDGFTGFTPIQNRLIQELMRVCGEVILTITLGAEENPYEKDGEQKLFYLSKKTVADLEKLAAEAGVAREKDVVIKSHYRFLQAPALHHLEKNLFRYPYRQYDKAQQEICLFETTTPREEVHQTGLKIRDLIRERGLAYRDIAVIMGDLEGYAPYVETEFSLMDIPYFIDRTRGILLNPLIEYIKSAFMIQEKDFSYETVFHYLRSGLADFTPEETDRLENYCIQTGLRGQRAYSRLFTHKTAEMEEEEAPLEEMNQLRERLMQQLAPILGERQRKVSEYVEGLYAFLVENQAQNKLAAFEQQFTQEGDLSRAREYAQIYRLVMELLDQIYELLGEEVIPLSEFLEILEAGFGEIEVGTIPQNVDRVVVGDMERTRLKQVKVLFFLGVNDGNIPKNVSKGGIISDMDREFLQESELELAPSPRQQMYIQRLYLYLNVTKPSEQLYLSYSKMNSAGKSLRPAYFIDTIKKLFPKIPTEYPQLRPMLEQIVTTAEGAGYLAEGLRAYAAGTLQEEQAEAFYTLYAVYGEETLRQSRDVFTQAAFKRYEDTGLSAAVARALYGKYLENSVTRLETYAACAYRHFLQYGLSLKERQEFSFETVDMGNVYHAVLEAFAAKLSENGYTWFDFSEEFGRKTITETLEAYAATYGDTVLYSSARNEYAIVRMARILTRTVLTLQKQLQKGSFTPEAYEISFQAADGLSSVNLALSEQEKMHLQGRIDRIDVAEDADHVYVKVIDYKSGNKQFDLAALYYGLQLQLVIYMNTALELEAKKHPGKEIVPAALLYYHIEDPSVETPVELTEEELEEELTKQLRMNGVVNAAPDIIEKLDRYMENKSDVIPVEKKKDGSFSARSSVMTAQELHTVSRYVSRKMVEIGKEILQGKISLNPYERGTEEACTYCAFRKVCGFENSLPGCEKRKLEDLDREELFSRMSREMGEE